MMRIWVGEPNHGNDLPRSAPLGRSRGLAMRLGGAVVALALLGAPQLALAQEAEAPATEEATGPVTDADQAPTAMSEELIEETAIGDGTGAGEAIIEEDVVGPEGAVIEEEAVGPMSMEPTTEEVENPYGLQAMWEHGDWVSKGTLIVLVIMSMGTWYILFSKLWDQQKVLSEASNIQTKFWDAGGPRKAREKLSGNSAFRQVVEDGLEAEEMHRSGLTEEVGKLEWVHMSLQRSVDRIAYRLQGGLSFLATVGSTAPFVGLFGTVWGIYHALVAIGVSGQATIDKVAGPVGEALIMTAIGLAVAVPAVLGYNFLVRRNKAATEHLRKFANDVAMVLSSKGVISKSSGSTTASPAGSVSPVAAPAE